MKSPPINRKSFGNKFNNYWRPLINREFFLGRDPFQDNRMSKVKKRPPFNLKKLEGYYLIEIPLPGYQKKQISIQLNNNVLIVKGKKEEDKELKSNYILKEHHVENFEHSYQLGKFTNQNNITVTLTNGILTIKLYSIDNDYTKEKRRTISIV